MTQIETREFTSPDGRLHRVSVAEAGPVEDTWLVRCVRLEEACGPVERLLRDSVVSGRDEAWSVADRWRAELERV